MKNTPLFVERYQLYRVTGHSAKSAKLISCPFRLEEAVSCEMRFNISKNSKGSGKTATTCNVTRTLVVCACHINLRRNPQTGN